MTIKDRSEMGHREVIIDLSGPQGNAFYLLGQVKNFGKQLGFDREKIEKIREEMMSGDYEHLVKIFDKYFGMVVTLYR